ncbi:hypothetical protein [Winogradskyella immobilis]|uniref:Uncharacterized protein n=1 Tax=Winogradskyella immobilis TaxID=2816852 RepID=A0ABS8ELZ4_9FLAO|nr:hypothetical protein [Winogradskyella immobilis]MCC1484239.1 hypothetical protein [Winogradskyella immobilis]MCG0016331.1 hypothetical protein [Winogradskyella immobilis]
MPHYKSDRNFTNYVHDELAIPIIYNNLGWMVKSIDAEKLQQIDINDGIDYVLTDKYSGNDIKVQERFRDNYYQKYNDATLRYRRATNKYADRIESEYYKIQADYLVYGITNGKKFKDQRHTLSGFIKWVVLDLKFIQEQFKMGNIKIVSSSKKTCWVKESVLFCPENFNPDGSSSFLPLDIKLIVSLWGNTPIRAQKGFL